MRDVLRGNRAEHPQPVKRAAALQLQALEECFPGLHGQATSAVATERLRACRNEALILLGFWRAFRSDDLCQLQVEHINVLTGTSLQIFLASGKTDRDHQGRTVVVPALKRLCPVVAYEAWLIASVLQQGPMFRAVDRWGHVSTKALNANSVSRLLRMAFARNDLDGATYSGHSLLRVLLPWPIITSGGLRH